MSSGSSSKRLALENTEPSVAEDSRLLELDQLQSANDADAELLRGDDTASSESDVELVIAAPRVLDLRVLHKQLKLPMPAHIMAALGAKRPVLLCHTVTPFYKPGRNPSGVHSIGYSTQVEGQSCRTVDLFPHSRLVKVLDLEQQVTFGLSLAGEFAPSPAAITAGMNALTPLAGLQILNANVRGETTQSAGLTIRCSFSFIEVQAGPAGAGGARWNLYRTAKRIDVSQVLLQTLLVPEDIHHLLLSASCWLRRPRRWLALRRVHQWAFPEVTFEVDLT